jgi:hypothetical protein
MWIGFMTEKVIQRCESKLMRCPNRNSEFTVSGLITQIKGVKWQKEAIVEIESWGVGRRFESDSVKEETMDWE